MSDKKLPSSLDAALAHVDPDRRKFLGMLLAGVAAVPLLTSAALNAEDKTHFPKSQMKAQTWNKGGAPLKSQDDKHNGEGAHTTVKHGPLDFSKGAPRDGTSGKHNNSIIKSSK